MVGGVVACVVVGGFVQPMPWCEQQNALLTGVQTSLVAQLKGSFGGTGMMGAGVGGGVLIWIWATASVSPSSELISDMRR